MQYKELPIGCFFKIVDTNDNTIFYKMSTKKVFNTSDLTVGFHLKNVEVEDLGLTHPDISIMTFAEVPLYQYFQFIDKDTKSQPVFKKTSTFGIRKLGHRSPSVYKQKGALVLRLGEDISDFVPPILVGVATEAEAPIAH